MAIGHQDGEDAVVDVLREVRHPFSPESVVEDFCADLSRYRIGAIRSDRHAALWPREQFQKRGVEYITADKVKTDLYHKLLPALNSTSVDLLDNERRIAGVLPSFPTGDSAAANERGSDGLPPAKFGHGSTGNSRRPSAAWPRFLAPSTPRQQRA